MSGLVIKMSLILSSLCQESGDKDLNNMKFEFAFVPKVNLSNLSLLYILSTLRFLESLNLCREWNLET